MQWVLPAPASCRPLDLRGVPRPLVPLEALHSCERAREGAETQAADMHAALVRQRLRHAAARLGFVVLLERLRSEAAALGALAAWRLQAVAAQVGGEGCNVTSALLTFGLH